MSDTTQARTLADEARQLAACLKALDYRRGARIANGLASGLDAKDAELQRLREALEWIVRHTPSFDAKGTRSREINAIAHAALSPGTPEGDSDGR